MKPITFRAFIPGIGPLVRKSVKPFTHAWGVQYAHNDVSTIGTTAKQYTYGFASSAELAYKAAAAFVARCNSNGVSVRLIDSAVVPVKS